MEPAIEHVLALRERADVRSQLRRALSPTTAHYAYPYLGRWWADAPWKREPLLTVAGLAALLDDVRHDRDTPLARYLAIAARRGEVKHQQVEQQLVSAMTMPLRSFAMVLRSMLIAASATPSGLDWSDLYRVLCNWDHPDAEKRRRVRVRVLEGFYAHLAGPESNDDNEQDRPDDSASPTADAA